MTEPTTDITVGRTIPRIIIRPGITIGPIIMVRDTMDITGTGRLTSAAERTIITADMAEAIIMEAGAAAITMEGEAAAGTKVADIAGRTS